MKARFWDTLLILDQISREIYLRYFALTNSTTIEFNLGIQTSSRTEQLLDSSEKSGS